MQASPICLDASLVLRLLESGTYQSPVVQLWGAWHEGDHPLVAPTLLYYEASNALRRYVAHGELLLEEAAEALEAALGLDIALYGDRDLHRQALALAGRFSLPAAYAAHYLALTERLGAEFWTADRQLTRALGDAMPWVHQLDRDFGPESTPTV
jgi:predicted nucleic acid-binding protein